MPHVRTAIVTTLLALVVGVPSAPAATPLSALRYASDITVDLSGTTLTPADVGEDDLVSQVMLIDLGDLPADVHIDAYQPASGDEYLSFDTTVTLPGGVVAAPADVVRRNGTSFSILFDAAANGIPEGVNVDAVTSASDMGVDLALSFDTAVRLDGVTFEDEDLVRFDALTSQFTPLFVGAAAGVPDDLDLDGAQILANGHFLLSFDGSGSIDGVDFNDEDVLEYDGAGGWELVYRGAAHHADLAAGDLVGLFGLVAGNPSPTPTATGGPTDTAVPTLTAPLPTATATPPGSTATATLTVPLPTATATLTAPPSATPATPIPCVGDCDGSGEVTISELLTMVNIALGNLPVSNCRAGDADGTGEILINELLIAVNNALNGC